MYGYPLPPQKLKDNFHSKTGNIVSYRFCCVMYVHSLLKSLCTLETRLQMKASWTARENAGFICANASVTIAMLSDKIEGTPCYHQIWNARINHTSHNFTDYSDVSLYGNYNTKSFILIHWKCQNICTVKPSEHCRKYKYRCLPSEALTHFTRSRTSTL
jgi:hypothetical protein